MGKSVKKVQTKKAVSLPSVSNIPPTPKTKTPKAEMVVSFDKQIAVLTGRITALEKANLTYSKDLGALQASLGKLGQKYTALEEGNVALKAEVKYLKDHNPYV